MKGLIVYVSTGNGFKSPAVAVSKELEARGHVAPCLDFFREIGSDFWHDVLTRSWIVMLDKPFLFRLIFPVTNSLLALPIKLLLRLTTRRKVFAYLDRVKPDFIFSTHFGTTAALDGLVKAYERHSGRPLPFFAYNSDVILSHVAYVAKNTTRYFVSTDRGIRAMTAQGMDPALLTKSEFPLDPKYIKTFRSIREERETLGLKDMFTVLVSMGGEGVGDLSFLEAIAASGAPVQLVVICGRNKALLARLEAMKAARPDFELAPRGFMTNMQDYLYACDISAGKAGLNTVFESIAMKRPFLVLMAMANEIHAARFVEEEGYGFWAKNVRAAADFTVRAASDPSVLAPTRSRLETPPCAFGTAGIADSVEAALAEVHPAETARAAGART
ncbi:MAG: hypothetical protein NT080_07245 [Spirochaetes bacterium]|nr:hypothetical protein [Spirochaetota bacterium]